MISSKKIPIEQNIHQANLDIAIRNKEYLQANNIFSINIMASPGAGKTSLIEATIDRLKDKFSIAVIDGDIATSIDADRAAARGAVAYQINTGGTCHIDAPMLETALQNIDLSLIDLLIVENVGNLICPAAFTLGTNKSVLIASTPEGADKPYKYPTMYQDVDILLLNKIDLLPYLQFDMDYFIRGVELLNANLTTIPISCVTSEGIDVWISWLISNLSHPK